MSHSSPMGYTVPKSIAVLILRGRDVLIHLGPIKRPVGKAAS